MPTQATSAMASLHEVDAGDASLPSARAEAELALSTTVSDDEVEIGAPTVSLSLTEKYAPHWSSRQGVREIVQNWFDGVTAQRLELEARAGIVSTVRFRYVDNETSHATQSFDPLATKQSTSEWLRGFPPGHQTVYFAELIASDAPSSSKLAKLQSNGSFSNPLGAIVHDTLRHTLTFLNQDTQLTRKILLLGYSTKREQESMVGSFGEGLKVGVLALLREKRVVWMATGGELWKFGVYNDPTFEERVLAVYVRSAEQSAAHKKYTFVQNLVSSVFGAAVRADTVTTTTVTNLDSDLWSLLKKDFLFLHVGVVGVTDSKEDSDVVHTEVGDLLLADEFAHKLYVKGFWVSDLPEDLQTGVNLSELQVDRDRRAVMKIQDIHQRISNVWARAIMLRKDLIPRYFKLLQEHSHMADVRHAAWYLTESAVNDVADHFVQMYDEDTVPVSNQEDMQQLIAVGGRHRPVLVPDALLGILSQSSHIPRAADILAQSQQSVSKSFTVQALPLDQLEVLNSVASLLRLLDPTFTVDSMEVCSFSHDRTLAVSDANVMKIDRRLLDVEFVHRRCGSCQAVFSSSSLSAAAAEVDIIGTESKTASCKCREVAIVKLIVAETSRPRLQPVPSRMGTRDLSKREKEDRMTSRVMEKVVARCFQLHKDNAQLKRKALEMQQRLSLSNAHSSTASNAQPSGVSPSRQTSPENSAMQMIQSENAVLKKQLEEAKASAIAARAREQELKALNAQLSGHQLGELTYERLAELENVHLDSLRLVTAAKERTLREEMKTLQQSSQQLRDAALCVVCTQRTICVVFLPCAHRVVCAECSGEIKTCPMCRAHVRSSIKHF